MILYYLTGLKYPIVYNEFKHNPQAFSTRLSIKHFTKHFDHNVSEWETRLLYGIHWYLISSFQIV